MDGLTNYNLSALNVPSNFDSVLLYGVDNIYGLIFVTTSGSDIILLFL